MMQQGLEPVFPLTGFDERTSARFRDLENAQASARIRPEVSLQDLHTRTHLGAEVRGMFSNASFFPEWGVAMLPPPIGGNRRYRIAQSRSHHLTVKSRALLSLAIHRAKAGI